MPFNLPHFNLLANVWVSPNDPSSGPADVVNVHVQLYLNSRGLLDIAINLAEEWNPPIWVRIDPADLGGLPAGAWIWEVPAASGEFYHVRWKQAFHVGFPNEYTAHLVAQCNGVGHEVLRDVV